MKWYVLQVKTGMEYSTSRELQRRGVETMMPTENRVIRHRGQWCTQLYRLFPGYLFIHVNFTDVLYYQICDVPGVIKILKASGNPAPLTEEEAARITSWRYDVLAPSVVERLPDGGCKAVSGILRDIAKDEIIKVDWHQRRAFVRMTLAGSPKIIVVSIDVKTPDVQTSGNAEG